MQDDAGESGELWTGRFRVDGIDSAARAAMVEAVVQSLGGVRWARVDYGLSNIEVQAAQPLDEAQLAEAVARTGCRLRLMGDVDPEPEPEAPRVDVAVEDDFHPSTDQIEIVPDVQSEPAPSDVPSDDDVEQSPFHFPAETDDAPADQPTWRERNLTPRAIIRFLGLAIVWGFGISVVWVLIYRFVPVPFTLTMLGDTFERGGVYQSWTPLEKISPWLIRSVIASEDNEFCHHSGFDFDEIQDAWEEAQSGGRVRGASTISQQTAKNAFLWGGRLWIRKGAEAYFTVLIEQLWPKRRIMEVYLNVAEWGPGVYGAQSASRYWFHKDASKLTPMEAARLAAILPNPRRYRASAPGPYIASRGFTINARANSVDLNGDDRCAHP